MENVNGRKIQKSEIKITASALKQDPAGALKQDPVSALKQDPNT